MNRNPTQKKRIKQQCSLPQVGCTRGDASSTYTTNLLPGLQQTIGFLVTIILNGDSLTHNHNFMIILKPHFQHTLRRQTHRHSTSHAPCDQMTTLLGMPYLIGLSFACLIVCLCIFISLFNLILARIFYYFSIFTSCSCISTSGLDY